MKIHTILLALPVLIGLVACDTIEAPYTENNNNGGGNTDKRVQKILLEEYTGFRCQTCPAATEVAVAIHEEHKEQVVLIAVHAGFFAQPLGGKYTYDFRTPVGDELNSTFDVTTAATPNGMVNRTEYNGFMLVGENDWEGAVLALLEKEALLSIDLGTEYDNASRELTVTADLEYFEDGAADNYLAVYIVESGIIQYQLDNRKDPKDVPDYEHNHVLRASLNGTWGKAVKSDGVPSAGEKLQHKYSLTLEEEWVAENCQVIAYVHKFDSTWEILQVEEARVIEN